jgi:hypothetical protein
VLALRRERRGGSYLALYVGGAFVPSHNKEERYAHGDPALHSFLSMRLYSFRR